MTATRPTVLSHGHLPFTVESRVLRELGERLVKQPEVAVVELLKNAYDADATECSIDWHAGSSITISDDGVGMTLARFTDGWMRIGTSSKTSSSISMKYGRSITGEKGIGRFAVRFLGHALHLESVADDPERGTRTKLIADFDWTQFDKLEDLGKITVPYSLVAADNEPQTGTTLQITRLRQQARSLDLRRIRTSSLEVLTPVRSMFVELRGREPRRKRRTQEDPGFTLKLGDESHEDMPADVSKAILDRFVLRGRLEVRRGRLSLAIYRRDGGEPYFALNDRFDSIIGSVDADIRFFPRREGSFTGMPVDGRRVQGWIASNCGVAVFDRSFRVQPYGAAGDDWLQLEADAARNWRDPRSTLAKKYFPMSEAVRNSTSENWMLRLPQETQLVGIVVVSGQRSEASDEGLIASADREGFVENAAFEELRDMVRGAVEAIAYADRKIQIEQAEASRKAMLRTIRRETRAAISEIEANPNISKAEKSRIVETLSQTQYLAERQDEAAREREQQLEVMSLLGVVAGFMTHEFGVAVADLEEAQRELVRLSRRDATFKVIATKFDEHLRRLRDFVTYSSGYVQGSRNAPTEPYPARPRLQQVKRVFGEYAEQRGIRVDIEVDRDLAAPLVPPSLYNGVALNLYTNALKAVTATKGKEGVILFRATNDARWHTLEVVDTGVGIPSALRERIFDPLFTTTQSKNDPLGSGMGLGLALVRRGVAAFNGRVDVVEPPAGFSTCIRVKLPLE
jgi:signal transduction histidine kinase